MITPYDAVGRDRVLTVAPEVNEGRVPVSETVLITGAAGTIGSLLRGSLARPGRQLRLFDRVALDPPAVDDADVFVATFDDAATMDEACRGADAVIHLGGLSTSGYTWEEYARANVAGTLQVLEAARRAHVARFIFASSNHVVGFQPTTDGAVPDYLFPRPDTLYGVSKAAGESLASLYHDRYGIDVVCLRIGSYRLRPDDERSRWSWLSPGDCTRLFEAALHVEHPGFRVVWGVSANASGLVSLAEGEAIGYRPQDNAEEYLGPPNDKNARAAYVGGDYVSSPLSPDTD